MITARFYSSVALTLCVLCGLLPLAAFASDTVSVTISSDKPTYVVGEPIRIIARLRNSGSRDIDFLPDEGYRLFNLIVTDSSGTAVAAHRVNHVGVGSDRSARLGTDQDFEVGNELTEWGYELQPGTYNISASFDQSFPGRKHAVAPAVTITVLPKS